MKPTSLDDNIIFQCSDFSHQFNLVLGAELQNQEFDLTPEQLSILVALWYKGKATQQEISRHLRRDKTTITRVIRHLEAKSLVYFSPHPTDSRSRLAAVTPRGAKVQDAAISISGSLYARVLKGIAPADLGIALKVLARMTRNCVVLIFCIFTGMNTYAQSPLARKYRPGDTYRYRLTCESYTDGKWSSTNISVCLLTVVVDSAGNPNDEIRWESLRIFTAKDTVDGSAEARSIKPYRVSLLAKGQLDLPPLSIPAMTESITDFNTFLVAISRNIGIDSLKKTGDSIAGPVPVIGNFANGKTILIGEDCISISARLDSLIGNTAQLQTSFMPPPTPHLHYLLPAMDTPVVAGCPNNFQMVMPATPQHYNIQYGREFFVIHSTVGTKDGKLLKADMFNQLTLQLKVNCDEHFRQCQVQLPISIQRRLTVELLPEKMLH
jgi:DNA-binding MarR family transcriptional regulator